MFDFIDNVERGILHLATTDRGFLVEAMNMIQPEYFDCIPHQIIYSLTHNYFEKYKELPPKDVLLQEIKNNLQKNESLSDYEDELEEIHSINEDTLANKEYYMDLVENFAKKQAIKDAIKKGITLVQEDKIDEIEFLIKEAIMVGRQVDYGSLYFHEIQERWERETSVKSRKVFPTILPACNAYLNGGNNAKELAMVVAAPGIGKSLYLVNQAVSALFENKKVLYITLEMSSDKVSKRFDSVITGIPNNKLNSIDGHMELTERLVKFRDKYKNSFLVIKEFPTATATANNIRQILHNLENHEGFVPELICIDYLELLLPIRKTDSEYAAQQRIAEEIRGIAMEYNVLVWTATQTNRQGESVEIITRKELGDSYGKIRVADWAISLNQTTEEYDNGRMRAYVMKARDAKQKYIVPMRVDYETLIMEQDKIHGQAISEFSG